MASLLQSSDCGKVFGRPRQQKLCVCMGLLLLLLLLLQLLNHSYPITRTNCDECSQGHSGIKHESGGGGRGVVLLSSRTVRWNRSHGWASWYREHMVVMNGDGTHVVPPYDLA